MLLGCSQPESLPTEETMTGANYDAPDARMLPIPPPPVPTVLPPPAQISITSLPTLPMSVLSIVMLGEFLSSNVSVPFLLFMVKGFGYSDEADAAFWTGILVAMFFLSQFLTSLLWAQLAETYGRRFVLVVTLLGSSISVTAFGLCKTIGQAMCARLVQGIFAGAVGVARGSVISITDSSNEGRAYAILGFCWGFGGLLGPIIGGTFERPAERWPVFQQWKLLEQFPYLLSTAVAGLILFAGSFLACFLSRDGGTVQTIVQIHPEKFESLESGFETSEQVLHTTARSPNGTLRRNRSSDHLSSASGHGSLALDRRVLSSPASSGIPIGPRTFTMSSSGSHSKSHYFTFGQTSGSLYHQTTSLLYTGPSESLRTPRIRSQEYHDVNDISETQSIAERVVLANENAVNSIADLWVAAALNVEGSNMTETQNGIERYADLEAHDLEEGLVGDGYDLRGRTILRSPAHASHHASIMNQRSKNSLPASRHRSRCVSSVRPMDAPLTCPTGYTSTGDASFTPQRISSLFMNSGVSTPHAALDNYTYYNETDLATHLERELPPILESRQPSTMHINNWETTPLLRSDTPSPYSPLPLLVIFQFGLLALHTTTHDQVFMSYLVSAYDVGGLNLSSSDFAQLIALMGLAQIFYQFYFYPNIGPPRGRLSHLTMYRLGTFLFIPAYLTVVVYRTPFAHPDDYKRFALMTALTISTAVRYCGMTFAFTSISVLINYMTPPEAVGYANGLAQTIVSLARCLGPVLGGWLWSASVEGHPSGYPCGFVVCAAACVIAIVMTVFIT